MVQDQLVEYITSQLKLGVSRDAVKAALTGVGWAALDVEDTLKKVEGASAPMAVSAQARNPEPQTVRVSDLVSSTASTSVSAKPASLGVMMPSRAVVQKDVAAKTPVGSASPLGVAPSGMASSGKRRIGWVAIIALVLVVVFAGAAAYLFIQNNNLSSQLQTANNQSQGSSQAVATQIQALNASNTALAAEVASATATNQELLTNLSFLVAPIGSSTPATSTSISASGLLAAGLGKDTYMITTPYGIKIAVQNSFNKNVAAALQPLLGTTVQLSGMYLPGVPAMTVVSVNGNAVTPPAPAVATSTTDTATSSAATSTAGTKF